MVGVYLIAKILTMKGTRRLVSLDQNDKTITYVVFQWAAVGIRSYAFFGRFRDVEDAVPYVIYINNCSTNPNLFDSILPK